MKCNKKMFISIIGVISILLCQSNCEAKKYKDDKIIEMQRQIVLAFLKVQRIPEEDNQVKSSIENDIIESLKLSKHKEQNL